MYRHPRRNLNTFTSHLGEFLEGFATRGLKLTMMGDFNIDLNKDNTPSNEYMKTLNSLGFSALINQPTRIVKFEGTNHLCCSTLDHLITNSTPSFSKAGILISDVSDHLPTFGVMKLTKINESPLKILTDAPFQIAKKKNLLNVLLKIVKTLITV